MMPNSVTCVLISTSHNCPKVVCVCVCGTLLSTLSGSQCRSLFLFVDIGWVFCFDSDATYLMRDVFPVLWKRTFLALQKIWRSSDLEKIVTLPGRSCHRNDIAQSKGKEEETHYLLSNFLLPICLIVMPCTKYVLAIYPSCKSQRCEYHRRLHRCHFKRHILPQCPTLSWTSLSKTSCSFLTDVPSVSLWACK